MNNRLLRSTLRIFVPLTMAATIVAAAPSASASDLSADEAPSAEALALPDDAAVTEGAAPAEATEAAGQQIMIWNATMSQTASSYWAPALNQPANYVSPINYAGGTAMIKIQILSKPSSKSMKAMVCFWRHGTRKFQYETCRTAGTFSNEGTYYTNLGTPAGWWDKAGGYDWTKRASVGRIMLVDPGSGRIMMSSKCGRVCYNGGDLGQHIPVKMSSMLVFVAKGSSFVPPAGW